MVLTSVEDEQQIFDTINSLGVRLTTAQLLKKYFFKHDKIDIYEKYWKKYLKKMMKQKPIGIEKLLRVV